MTATVSPPETACERTLELPAVEVSFAAWAVIGRSGQPAGELRGGTR